MGQYFLKNSKILYEAYDFSPDFREMDLTLTRDGVEDTAFGDGAHSTKPGLQGFDFTASGFVDHAALHNEVIINADWGATDGKVFTILPESADEGKIAYTTKGITADYSLGGAVGEMSPFSMAAHSKGERIIRGTIMASGAKTSTGSGTARQLGLVGSTQYLYGTLHVTAISGTDTPTITVLIVSDDAANMASATTRISFSASTVIEVQWATPIAGAIADDDYWQMTWTVSGTDPSLTVYGVIGIQ